MAERKFVRIQENGQITLPADVRKRLEGWDVDTPLS